jgi:hypothetical protein
MRLLTIFLLCISVSSIAQIRTNYYGDTVKGNIQEMVEYRPVWDSAMKHVYFFDQREKTERANFFTPDNTLVGSWYVKYDDSDRASEKMLYLSIDTVCEDATTTYDEHGNEIEWRIVNYVNSKCNSLVDYLDNTASNWVTGRYWDYSVELRRFQYDTLYRLIKEEVKNFHNGSPASDTTCEATINAYNAKNGKIAQTIKESYKVGATDTAREIISYEYDSKGRKIEEISIIYNRPWNDLIDWDYLGKKITTRTLYKYDSSNNRIEETEYFFSKNKSNRTHSGTQIGAGSYYTFDEHNNMLSDSFYYLYKEDDGSETKDISNTHNVPPKSVIKNEYDEHGNVVRKGSDDNVIFHRQITYY